MKNSITAAREAAPDESEAFSASATLADGQESGSMRKAVSALADERDEKGY